LTIFFLEAAISITAKDESGEFLEDPGAREWCADFGNPEAFQRGDIDQEGQRLAASPLDAAFGKFIRRHCHVL
jgi:hypothetical protein